MEHTIHWQTESSSNFVSGTVAPFESTQHIERLNALRDLALMLLREVESLQIDQAAHARPDAGLQNQVRRFECELIRQALHQTGGNQSRAARLLGVKHTTLNAKIRRYEIPIGEQAQSENAVHDQGIAG
jgi:DNA-binding NtrC family response regulator